MCAFYNCDRARDGREDDDKRWYPENNAVTREETTSHLQTLWVCDLIARIILVTVLRTTIDTMETTSYKNIVPFFLH